MNILNKTSIRRNISQSSVKKQSPFSFLSNFKQFSFKISLSRNLPILSNQNFDFNKKNSLHIYKINCFSSSIYL